MPVLISVLTVGHSVGVFLVWFFCSSYGTETHIRDVLSPAFRSGAITRKDVFLSTKVAHPKAPPHVAISAINTWNARDVPDVKARTHADFELSLDRLGVGYTDVLLMHWPGTFSEKDEAFARATRASIWKAMEECLAKKTCRAIGVCNFTVKHLQQLIEDCDVVPHVNQLEVHPYCVDADLIKFCQDNKILVQAYAPFASGAFGLLKDATLVALAEKYDVSVGQVVLRWHHQHGRVPVPKSTSPTRIPANLDFFRFELTADEMASVDALSTGEPQRTCPAPDSVV